ncbi:MAG: response regulator transcription factor [Chitinophagales bacterium]|nr:response regulator transcription factor [Bacteroidota bacterium]
MENIKILVVDDEPDILEFVKYNLEKEGYAVKTALDGREGLELVRSWQPQLVLLDVMMPQLDGIEVCRQIRHDEKIKQPLIVFLTARSEDYSQIAGFDAGGDDYITKPIRIRVLVSRLKALLRRFSTDISEDQNTIKLDKLFIDKEKMLIYVDGEACTLAKKEYELLLLLVSKPGKVFSRDEIFAKVWGADLIVGERTIDVHIRKIREKIGENYIKTIKGIGYKFVIPAADTET